MTDRPPPFDHNGSSIPCQYIQNSAEIRLTPYTPRESIRIKNNQCSCVQDDAACRVFFVDLPRNISPLTDQMTNPFVLWPLLVFGAMAVLIVTAMILFSAVLGQRHRERTTGDPYESGIAPTGSSRLRFDVKFYLIAMFFVIFDLEAVFIFIWAVSARDLGWTGYLEICFFIGVLMLTLFYLWRLGGLDWAPGRPIPDTGRAGGRNA
jgi:NADH-quinone oxidoreductase subunit A